MATKKATATDEKAIVVEIPPIKLKTFKLTVIGDSSLIVHAWSEKAKKEMLDKQQKKASSGREKKNPIRDYVLAAYWTDGNGNQIAPPEVKDYETDDEATKEYARIQKIASESHFGFPACAFKAAAIDAGFQQGLIPKKTTARGAFHIEEELVEIQGIPEMREDMVRIGGISKTADIRYRPEFKDWRAVFTVTYNPNVISASQIMSLFEMGGFASGVGEWRPSRDGEHGRFHVEKN